MPKHAHTHTDTYKLKEKEVSAQNIRRTEIKRNRENDKKLVEKASDKRTNNRLSTKGGGEEQAKLNIETQTMMTITTQSDEKRNKAYSIYRTEKSNKRR